MEPMVAPPMELCGKMGLKLQEFYLANSPCSASLPAIAWKDCLALGTLI